MSFSCCLLFILIQILPGWEGKFAEDCSISQIHTARRSLCNKLMICANKGYLTSISFNFSFGKEKCKWFTEPILGTFGVSGLF